MQAFRPFLIWKQSFQTCKKVDTTFSTVFPYSTVTRVSCHMRNGLRLTSNTLCKVHIVEGSGLILRNSSTILTARLSNQFVQYPQTLQYCLFRPLTTLVAILLDRLGLYHEATFSTHSGWLYLTFMVNVSIAFAFAALATFYTTLKKKLAPYEPVGKFLCIKFVIFFAFWQSVVIAIFVRAGIIHDVGE